MQSEPLISLRPVSLQPSRKDVPKSRLWSKPPSYQSSMCNWLQQVLQTCPFQSRQAQTHIYNNIFEEEIPNLAKKKPAPGKTTRPFHKLREHQQGSALYVEPYATSPSTTYTNSPAPPNFDDISAATQQLPLKRNHPWNRKKTKGKQARK